MHEAIHKETRCIVGKVVHVLNILNSL